MTMQEKRELINSAIIVADFWGVEVTELLGFAALTNKDKKAEWNEITKEVIKFGEMSITERARAMGFEVVEEGENVTISTNLTN